MKTFFKTSIFLFFFLSMWSSKAFSKIAQDTSITQVSGYILDSVSHEPLSFITIHIKGSSRGMIANSQGFFSIAVRRTDTVIFTAVGFFPHRLIMSEQKRGPKLFVSILMRVSIFSLHGITVTAMTRERFRYLFLKLELPKTLEVSPSALPKPGELKLPPPLPGFRFSPSELIQDIPFVERSFKRKRSKKFVKQADPKDIPVMQ